MGKYTCPYCESDNTRSVPIVVSEGTTSGTVTNKEIVGHQVHTQTTTTYNGYKEEKETKVIGSSAIYGDVTRPVEIMSDLVRSLPKKPEPPSNVPPPKNFEVLDKESFIKEEFWEFTKIAIAFYVIDYVLGYVFSDGSFVPSKFTLTIIGICIIIFIIEAITYNQEKRQKKVDEHNKKREEMLKGYYQELYEWEHLYICMRCGKQFRVEDD